MSDNAIPAATLVVWRDPPLSGRNGPQILVVQRSARMAFAAGAIVFPGGRVDPADRALAESLGQPDQAAKVTAIRETIEESAVAAGLGQDVDPSMGKVLQTALIEGAQLGDLLSRFNLSLNLESLIPFARWMPAFKQPRKFDTLFYLTSAPAGEWTPNPQPGECVAAEWSNPAELVERVARGDANAIFPTKRNLERLAAHRDIDAAIADARAHSLETIIPWVEEIDGEPHVRIPGDRGYPVTSERLDTAFRA